MKHLTVLLAVILALWLAVAFHVGGVVDQVHRQLTMQVSPAAPLVLRPGSYHRGLLESATSTRLELMGSTLPSWLAGVELLIRHRVIHGPLPLAAWWRGGDFPRPAQTVIWSRVDGQSSTLGSLGILGDVLVHLRARIWVALDGLSRIQVGLPAGLTLRGSDASLRIAHLETGATLHAGGELASLTARIDTLRWCHHTDVPKCLQLSARLAGHSSREYPGFRWAAEGRLETAESLLVERLRGGFLARRAASGETVDDAAVSLAVGQARQQIALLVGAGILERRQDRLLLDFIWRDGRLELNGEFRPWQQVVPVLSVLGAQLMGEV